MTDKKHRGILSIAHLKARCTVDPVSHCWHWLGAKAVDGTPRIYTVDHARMIKDSLSGPKAVWNIAHGEAPRAGWLVFRACGCRDCVNPVHLAQARDKAEIGMHQRRAGYRKGTHVEARRASQKLACAAAGKPATAESIVRQIRALAGEKSQKALGLQFGVSRQTVNRIVLGRSHRHLLEAA